MITGPDASMLILLSILGIQTIAIVVIVFAVYKSSKQASKLISDISELTGSLKPDALSIAENTNNAILTFKQILIYTKDIASNLEEITLAIRGATDEANDVFHKTADKTEKHIDRLDHLFTDTIDRTKETTDYVTRIVYPQIVEIAALVKGIHTTIEYLRSKRRFPVADFIRS